MTKPCVVCGKTMERGTIGHKAFAKRQACSSACSGILRSGRSQQRRTAVKNEIEEEMTFDEIGARLGVTQQAAFQLYKRALAKLRKAKLLSQLAEDLAS